MVKVFRQYIVTDYSMALIHACVLSFNSCSLIEYLKVCWRTLHAELIEGEIQCTTFVVICRAHVMNAISRRLRRFQNNAVTRQVVCVWFTALQHCTSLTSAFAVYNYINLCLCSNIETNEVTIARQYLQTVCIGMEQQTTCNSDESQDLNTVVDSDNEIPHIHRGAENTLRSNSLFTFVFDKCLTDIVNDGQGNPNPTYAPSCFKVISDLIHMFPYGQHACKPRFDRFGKDNVFGRSDSRTEMFVERSRRVPFQGVEV
jgi:hypothetical protein